MSWDICGKNDKKIRMNDLDEFDIFDNTHNNLQTSEAVIFSSKMFLGCLVGIQIALFEISIGGRERTSGKSK